MAHSGGSNYAAHLNYSSLRRRRRRTGRVHALRNRGNGLPTSAATDPPTSDTETATPEPTPVPNVCEPNPDPATADLVQVDSPAPFTAVSSPVTVSGRIAAFEATFRIRIFDAEGEIAGGVTAMSAEGQTLSPFSADVEYQLVAESPGCIWVYEDSAMDGSPIHVAQIPVLLRID
jgi:hypothetical protein